MDNNSNQNGGESADGTWGVNRRRFLEAAGTGVAMTGLAGCLGSGVQEDGVIRIGSLAPEPATDPVGMSIQGGAQVAVDELNENGGILGREVELYGADTGGTAGGARDAYNELILDEGVDFTLGNFVSEALLGIVDDIAAEQRLHLITGVGTPEVTRMVAEDYDTYRYLFRVGPFNSYDLGQSTIDFAEENFQEHMGWDDIAILYEEAEWTGPVAEIMEDQMPDLGFNVVDSVSYSLGTSDFSPIFDSLEAEGVDGACTIIAHTGETITSQWYDEQREFGLGGIHVPAQFPIMWDAMEGAIEYVWTQTTAAPGVEITEKTAPFTEAFTQAYEMPPVYTGYIAYDAVHIFATYAEAADSTDPEDLIPMMAANEVSYTSTSSVEHEFTGPDAEFAHDLVYDRDDHMEGRSAPVWLQWQDGEQVTFFPDAHAVGEYQQPDWI